MSEIEHVTVFGSPAPGVEYFERRAAYAVIVNNGKIAMVKPGRTVGGKPNHFLPGGGSWPGEAPEDTVTREVTEELARSVLLIRKLGEVTQYFYADSDNRHYKMQAVFFAGEFTDEAKCKINAEHEYYWLPVAEAEKACFHACHTWAIRQAVAGPG